jgi:hypothetical protein
VGLAGETVPLAGVAAKATVDAAASTEKTTIQRARILDILNLSCSEVRW